MPKPRVVVTSIMDAVRVRKGVICMSAYEAIMVSLAFVGLILKLLDMFGNTKNK